MMYVRIKLYNEEGCFTSFEELYPNCSTLDDGIQRFRKAYPMYDTCLVTAEWYDSTEGCNKEHFEVCKACGCVQYAYSE